VIVLKRIILVTGPPGIGKTSVLRRTVKELNHRNYSVGGMLCREVREGGLRVGFEVMDLVTGQRGWLAHVNQATGPKVGKYHVNLTDLGFIGAGSIVAAVQNADILAIDEIGPMEFLSKPFTNALLQAVNSKKPLFGTIHYKLNNSIIEEIKKRDDTEIIEVTPKNRPTLHSTVADKITNYLI
jgi:nucleoside-triphosphatase